MSTKHDDLQLLRACVHSIQRAQSREAIGRVYEELVGYRLDEDDADADLEDLRAFALDYVRELCYAEGIPCQMVGIVGQGSFAERPADPTAIMDAPWGLPR